MHFLVHASKQEDREWLDWLVRTSNLGDNYKIINVDNEGFSHGSGTRFGGKAFAYMWPYFISDPDTLYFKIDDDIVRPNLST